MLKPTFVILIAIAASFCRADGVDSLTDNREQQPLVQAVPGGPAIPHPQIILGQPQLTLKVGETKQLLSTVKNSKLQATWASSNAGFATVNASGMITAIHPGTVIIRATLIEDEVFAECRVEVVDGSTAPVAAKAPREITGIVIANEIPVMFVGDELGIIATCLPYDVFSGNPYTLESSDPDVVQVNQAQIARAVAPGTVTLTVKTPNGHTDSLTFPVQPAPPALVPGPTETYQVELNKFGIVPGEVSPEQSVKNTAGINQVLLYAQRWGYQRVVFPKELYLLDPQEPISMRSNLQIDLNGSTWQIRPNDYVRYALIRFQELDWPNLFSGYEIATEATTLPTLGPGALQKFVIADEVTAAGVVSVVSAPIAIGPPPLRDAPDQLVRTLERGSLCLFSSPIIVRRQTVNADEPASLEARLILTYFQDDTPVASKDFGKIWIRDTNAKLWNAAVYTEKLRTEDDYNQIRLELKFTFKNCTAEIFLDQPAVRRKAAAVLENCRLYNGTILGERDFKEAHYPGWAKDHKTEGAVAISFDEGHNNGIENMTVRKSIGFNMSARLGQNAHGAVGLGKIPVKHTNLEFGDLNAEGKPVESSIVQRTKEFLDISAIGSTFEFGLPLGYMGYNLLRVRLYDICFYDADKNFLEKRDGRLTYRKYTKPAAAKFVKLVLHWDEPITDGSRDFQDAIGFITEFKPPTRNYIRNCIIEDNFSLGFAACGGINWFIEDNTFRRNGGRMPGFDIDWEDGWEYSQDDVVRNNSFESASSLVVCSGLNHLFINNRVKGNLVVHGRSQYMRFVGNTFGRDDKPVRMSFGTQTDTYIYGNTFLNGRANLIKQHKDLGHYGGIWLNNIFDRTSLSHAGSRDGKLTNNTFLAADEPLIVNESATKSKFTGSFKLGGSLYENCEFQDGSLITGPHAPERTVVFDKDKLKNITFKEPHANLVIQDSDWDNATGPLLILANRQGIPDVIKITGNRITLGGDKSLITAANVNALEALELQVVKNRITVPEGYGGYIFDTNWSAAVRTLPSQFKLTDNITNQPIAPAPEK